jgi:sugar phosphate isomerase/epimerase
MKNRSAEPGIPPKKPKVGIQLWTLRTELEADPRGTLKRLVEIGFAGVETAFFAGGFSLDKAPQLLREFGLPVCSAHCALPAGGQKQGFLDLARTFQCERMVWHGWPMDPRYESIAGTRELAEIYNEASRFAKSHGLNFGLHNHWWEFEKQKDGQYPCQVLVESLDPDVFFEVDTYWAKAAGQDPVRMIGQLAKRVPLMHIKDGPGDKTSPMVAVGTGVQDIKGIVSASQNQVEWLIVEFDSCATDIFVALQESYGYLTKNGLGEGRVWD